MYEYPNFKVYRFDYKTHKTDNLIDKLIRSHFALSRKAESKVIPRPDKLMKLLSPGFFCEDCNFSYFFLGWTLSGLVFCLLFALFDQIGLENKFAHSSWHTNFTWVCLYTKTNYWTPKRVESLNPRRENTRGLKKRWPENLLFKCTWLYMITVDWKHHI